MQKEEILAEIRRTAKENGGKPLGRERFERVTGIKPYDWAKYWVRFGDAQQEAGFEPNTLTSAYGEDYLMDKLVQLIKELNKFPTHAERRMKSLNDPSFPNPGTFQRLGDKPELIGKLLAYCSGKPELADVVELLESVKEDTPNKKDFDPETKDTKYGFVYLVRGHPGEYKIGRTNLVDRRLSELGATSSIEQTLIHEIKTDDPAGIESYWHRRFQDKRMKGEWFNLNPADVKAFTRWRRIY
jgi:hypothetical protein